MPARPSSWRDVVTLSPTQGARRNGVGLARPGGWNGTLQFPTAMQTTGGRGGSGGGRGQPNSLEQAEAKRALDEGGHEDFNLMNAGGRALLNALDIIDTPRAAVVATLFGKGGTEEWKQNVRDNASFGEVTGLSESDLPTWAKVSLGFAGDVAFDPLTYATGGAHKPGIEAGKPAARKFLEEGTQKFLGEKLAEVAEQGGRKFADDAERAAFIAEEGKVAGERAAQKSLRFRTNQALNNLEREAIGATPGTYLKVPGTGKLGRTLGIGKVADVVTGGRFAKAASGETLIRLTSKELPLGRFAGKAWAAVAESKVGDALAEVFTRFPTYRSKILHGTPEEAAKAFGSLSARNAGTLQRRLFETEWAGRLESILQSAKKARVDGEDLWMAAGEASGALGPATVRVEARAPGLVGEAKSFFEDIQKAANDIDPDFPWLMSIADYTPRVPSEDVAKARANRFATAGGALRKETFDFKRQLVAGEKLFDEELVEQAVHPKNWSVEKQIDDILHRNGVPNWNQTDAFKSFPEYVRRLSTRYGEEFMAKRLRDLGIADIALREVVSELGISQGQAKARILKVMTRARQRTRDLERETVEGFNQEAKYGRLEAQGEFEVADAQSARGKAQSRLKDVVDAPTPNLPAVQEWEQFNREAAIKVGEDRDAMMGRLRAAADERFGLNHAEVEASRQLNQATHQAYEHVTGLEAAISNMYDELGRMYDQVKLLDSEKVDYAQARAYMEREVPQLEEFVQGLFKDVDRGPAGDAAYNHARKQLADLKAAQADPELFTVWAEENFTKHEIGGNTGRVDERLQETVDAVTRLEGQLAESEALLNEMNGIANQDTSGLYERIDIVDEELAPRLAERASMIEDGYAPSEELIGQIESLANIKSSLLHETKTIERAQARATQLMDPDTIRQHLDVARDMEAMGDKVIHSLFPDLPPEVHGSRVRQYMNDRMGEIQEMIDSTQNTVLSAYTDHDTLRVDLDEVTKARRESERKLSQLRQDLVPKMEQANHMEHSLLLKAEEAAKQAVAIEDDLLKLDQEAPGLVHEVFKAEQEVNTAQSFTASMHAKRLMYEARATKAETAQKYARQVAMAWESVGKKTLSEPVDTVLQGALRDSWHKMGAVSQVKEAWLVDGLKAATIMSGPESIRPSLRMYDKVLNMWKGYALSTPGTVMRNIFGGVFNNWLAADLKFTDYTDFMRAHRAWGKEGFEKLPESTREAYRAIREAGILTGGGTSLEIERRLATGVSVKPWSPDFFYTRTFRAGQEEAENMLRGTLALDTIRKGGSVDDAIDKVFKFHFDYDDLSAMERSVFRRVVPFYTWTRKNLPLMMEQIMLQPQKFARFYQLKNEVELYSPEEPIVPSYFEENLAMRLPFQMGGSQSYMLPDLPFTSLNDVSDPSVAFSQLSPFVKTPIEYAFGRQMFKGLPLRDSYTEVPKTLAVPLELIPGAVPLLEASGRVQRNADGSLAMKQKDLYVVEQFLPVYGKARRLFPSEQQYDNRAATAWLSWAFGLGLRSNTPQDVRNEASRRVRRRFEDISTTDELGYLPDGTKRPRLGQTINAAYDQLGVPKDEDE